MKLDELARLAGVSRTTASYVINGKAKQYRVSDKTVERVLAIAKQYQFQPNAVAAGLRAGKTNSIGLIVPDILNNSYARIANYLERLARERGYQVLIACSDDNIEIERQCLTHLHQRRVDAVIVSSAAGESGEAYLQWDNRVLPIIALDRELDPARFIAVTGSDYDDAVTLASAFREQVSDGDVLYLGAMADLPVSHHRESGFKSAWKASSLSVNYLHVKHFNRRNAEEEITKWLETHTLPAGIFTTSFTLLQGVMDAILKKFAYFPDELVIATFGDNELLDFLPCAVLTAAQKHQELAEKTLDLIIEAVDSAHYQPKKTIISRQLMYRGKLNRQHKV